MTYRTHMGGDLRSAHEGERVTVAGWVARRRDHGGLVFVDLRDQAGLVQLVFNPEEQPEAHAGAHALRAEFVVQAEGVVRRRAPETVNPRLATGEVEIHVERLDVLNTAPVLPFQLDDDGVDETLRLHHRYLDLRRDSMRHNVRVRFALTQSIRRYLEERGFWELETPILYKSTPEGAREFLVPTSSHPGRFYALPQSPQTYKQLYVISGFERYYQIARCFRDEATRADRTAEFTQLDLEMAFVQPDELHALMEGLFQTVWRDIAGIELDVPFPRMTHAEAMLRYASDKPDTRFGCEIADVTDALRGTEFKAFRGVIDAGGVVRGFAVPGALEFSRKDFDGLVEFAKTWGGKGVALAPAPGRRGSLADREVPGARRARRHRRRRGGERGRHRAARRRRRGRRRARAGPAAPPPRRAARSRPGGLELPLGDGVSDVRVAARREPLEGQPQPVLGARAGGRGRLRGASPRGAGAPVRPRPERQRGRRRAPSETIAPRCRAGSSRCSG